jgi:hypothetical protein
MSKLIAFTSNFADNSTEAGFQFTFYCDICREGYKTTFIESKTYSKWRFIRLIGDVVGAVARATGHYNIGYSLERGSDAISDRFRGMSPAWHKEHEAAFEIAQNEAKGHFHRCPKCKKWVCENDWNEQEMLCVNDAPRVNIEVAAARAKKMVSDINVKAEQEQVFHGEIESKQTICPSCGKPSGEGKFCNNCGASLSLVTCQKCGAKSQPGIRFCGECGTNIG